ncbi:hypothetical protein JYU12_01140, partial [bacterium AH-315-K03]|nr:hypothetical protein [bacterium AH-315-K03]
DHHQRIPLPLQNNHSYLTDKSGAPHNLGSRNKYSCIFTTKPKAHIIRFIWNDLQTTNSNGFSQQ